MERPERKDLVLIVARELASLVATPIFVVDPEGRLVYYNEPAEEVLGLAFAEAGELAAGEWGTMWAPQGLDGRALAVDELPLTAAFRDEKPAHRAFWITPPGGPRRLIEVTAFPLFARTDRMVGAVAIFWESRNRE